MRQHNARTVEGIDDLPSGWRFRKTNHVDKDQDAIERALKFYDDSELVEVLTEIEKLFESCEYDDCCIGGDLNTDIRRDKVTVRAITTFMNKIGLVSVWEKFPIDFTHVHKDLKSFWIFDTFFCEQGLNRHG